MANLQARGVPFVFVTGYGEQMDLPPEARGAGAIKKPFDSAKLVTAVSKLLGRSPAG